MTKRPPNSEECLHRAYVASVRRYYARPDVHGIAIGVAYRRGKPEAHHAVRIHVTEKVTRQLLDPSAIFKALMPGVRLDVTEGLFVDDACETFEERTEASEAIQPGLSLGRRRGPAGTLGALVESSAHRRFILSAGHVLVGNRSDRGDPIFQPAREDGPGEPIANLSRFSREHDAAIAEIASSRSLRPIPLEATARFAGSALPAIGQVLRKSGRSTCCTLAKVDAIGPFQQLRRAVWLRPIDGDADDQRICQGGDSGSVWYDPDTMKAVALHLKGENVLGSRAIATQLASDPAHHYVGVLEHLRVSLL